MKKLKEFDFLENDDFGKYKPLKINSSTNALKRAIVAVGLKFEPNFAIKRNSFESWLYENLIFYFTDNEKCEWDLSKGLLFTGKKGLGKSLSLKIIRMIYYYQNNMPKLQVKKSFGMVGLETLSIKENGKLNNLEKFYQLAKKGNLFCDEVMRESANEYKQINNFGTIEQPFSTAMHSMYRNFTDKGNLYHFTTNYWNAKGYENGEILASVYGGEICDRLKEMCNIIEFKGESKRK